jgi:hypothetical protein
MTVTKRLFTAGLPAAGIIAAALAFTGQPASAAPADQAIGDAPQLDPSALFGTLTAGLGNVAGVPALPGLPLVGDLQGLPGAQTLPAVGGAGAADLPKEAMLEAARPREAGPMASGAGVSGMLSGDNDGILNGTQIAVPIQIPVNICGTGIGVLGIGAGQADCGPSDVALPPPPPPPPVDEEPPPPPPVDEEPPSYGSSGGPEDDELPVTGTPLVGLAGLGGLLTAGGAAMTMVGARTGVGASRYTGRHRSAI